MLADQDRRGLTRCSRAGLPADLWRLLAARHGPLVAAIMVALHLDGDEPAVPDDHDALLVSVADTIVTVTTLVDHAVDHLTATDLVPRLLTFRRLPAGRVPPSMTVRYGHALAVLADRFTVPHTEPVSAHRGPPDERPPPW